MQLLLRSSLALVFVSNCFRELGYIYMYILRNMQVLWFVRVDCLSSMDLTLIQDNHFDLHLWTYVVSFSLFAIHSHIKLDHIVDGVWPYALIRCMLYQFHNSFLDAFHPTSSFRLSSQPYGCLSGTLALVDVMPRPLWSCTFFLFNLGEKLQLLKTKLLSSLWNKYNPWSPRYKKLIW